MSRLSPDTLLSIELGATCSRNRYTEDPKPVIAELRAEVGDGLDILPESVGTWAGFFKGRYTTTLCAALRELPGVEPWIEVGAGHAGASWPEHDGGSELRKGAAGASG